MQHSFDVQEAFDYGDREAKKIRKPRKSMRKFYEQQTGKKLPDDFDIHHIDFNHENNDILNLVALPKKVHQNYHISFINLHYLEENFFIPDPNWQHLVSTAEIDLILNQLHKTRDAYAEFCGWYNFRNVLLGRLQYFPVFKEFSY